MCLQILYARDVDQRSTTFEKSLHMGKEFQRRAKAMILRAAVLRNQIHVKVKMEPVSHEGVHLYTSAEYQNDNNKSKIITDISIAVFRHHMVP